MRYPRMDMKSQEEIVPSVPNAIDSKPYSLQDSLLLVIMPALHHVQILTDTEKCVALIGLPDKAHIARYLLNFILDMRLLPYGTVAGHNAATVFRTDHAPSRNLLLLASGDERKEIANDAMLALYPSSEKKDQEKCDSTLDTLPEFSVLATYIHKKMTTRMERPASEKVSV